MKRTILLSIFLSLQFYLAAQQPDDVQWIITSDGYQQGSSWINDPPPTDDIDVTIDYPNELITDDNGTAGVARNDFFIIFNDGTHYNGRFDTGFNHFLINPDTWSNSRSGYRLDIPSGKSIKYMYLTNIYEEDDPDELVESTSSSTAINPVVNTITPSSPVGLITANHDLVKNRDVTLIIPYPKLKDDCDGNIISLCLQVTNNMGGPPFSDYSGITLSNVFSGSAAINATINNTQITNQCFEDIVITPTQNYSYINLKMPQSLEDYVDESMVFYLKDNNGSECGTPLLEKIVDSNDPNFVAVQCVSNQCDQNIVKYRIECENISAIATNNVSLHCTLPYAFEELKLIKASVAGSSISPVGNPVSGQNLSFNLNAGLAQNESAFVEFCVKYTDIDIATADLKPNYPHTRFDGTVYTIEEFRDISTEKVKESKKEIVTLISRPVSADCGCAYSIPFSCIKWYWWAVVFLGIILLGFFGFKLFGGSKTS